MKTIDTSKITQICVAVRDAKETAKHWAAFFGVDEPEVFASEKYEITHAVYNGKPCNGRIYQAIFDFENIQVEIVSPVDDEPSYWLDWINEHGEGIHHLALRTKDMDAAVAELKDKNFDVIQRGSWPTEPVDGQYAYITTAEKLKCCLELLCF